MNLKENAQYALQAALKAGAQQVRVVASEDLSDSFSVRDHLLEKIYQAGESSLFFHLFVDGRYGTCSTNRTDPASVEKLVQDTIASTRLLAPDPDRMLAPAARCYKASAADPDLQGYDATLEHLAPESKKDLTHACAAQAYGKSPDVISVTAEYADSLSKTYLLDSQGLDCSASNTFFSVSAECTVQGKKGTRPSDWGCLGGITYRSLLPQGATLGAGEEALQRALAKRNPGKARSGRYTMVLENRVASQLVGPLIQAISGPSLQQRNSFLLDKIGTSIANSALTLVDNPFLAGATGARLFDNEGLATRPRTLIDKGVLTTYFLSTYHARKMQLEPTVDGPSVLQLTGGRGNAASLMAPLKKGIFVTGFNGGNCNSATGDFSYGIEGFLIRDGAFVKPISEMVVSGNMLDLWQHYAGAADDALSYAAWRIPSLLFDDIAFAGL